MSVHRSNFTSLWVTLTFILLPALVCGVPYRISEEDFLKWYKFEDIVPEEPLPLQLIEKFSNPNVIPNVDLGSIIQLPNVELPQVDVESKAPLAKEVVAVTEADNVKFAEASINNLDISKEHPALVQTISTSINDVKEKESTNKEGGNDEAVVLLVQEKPSIGLLSQEPFEVTYDLNHPKLAAAAKNSEYEALPVKDQTNLPIEEKDLPSVLSTTLVPVSEESTTTKSIPDDEQLKITTKEEFKELKKSKQVLLKILDQIVRQVLIEEFNLSVEEANEALGADHEDVEELEEISSDEEKVLLRRVIKVLDSYLLQLETRDIKLARAKMVLAGYFLSKSSSENSPQVVTENHIPIINNDKLENYLLPVPEFTDYAIEES